MVLPRETWQYSCITSGRRKRYRPFGAGEQIDRPSLPPGPRPPLGLGPPFAPPQHPPARPDVRHGLGFDPANQNQPEPDRLPSTHGNLHHRSLVPRAVGDQGSRRVRALWRIDAQHRRVRCPDRLPRHVNGPVVPVAPTSRSTSAGLRSRNSRNGDTPIWSPFAGCTAYRRV